MRDSVYLAYQYLRHHRLTTLILVASLTLILYLPAALQSIVVSAETHLRSRARSTPLIVGPRGSSLELVLQGVYFDRPSSEVMRYEQVRRIREQNMASAIPLHTRYTVRECQLIGTTLSYFEARKLKFSTGRRWDLLGECVVGATVAAKLDLQLGDKIAVSKSSAFLLADAPLRLRVVGVLEATETADDEVVFTDLETCWIADGLGHGHLRGAKHGTPQAEQFTDITAENVDSFHFHGDRNRFPITSMLVIPQDKKAETILLGQYFAPEETVQIVRPREVVDALLARVLMVRSYLLSAIALVSLVTLVMMGLVVALSIRMRQGEIMTMSKIGCSRFMIASLLSCQIALLLAGSVLCATLLTLATHLFGSELFRLLMV